MGKVTLSMASADVFVSVTVSAMNLQSTKKTSLFLLFALAFSAQAQTTSDAALDKSEQEPAVSEEVAEDTAKRDSVDPWQGYNRVMFGFNNRVDKALLKPLAKAYVRSTPAFFRQGVSNVFSNIGNVPSALNGVLQGKFSSAAHDSGRLLVNSTLGLAGIIDVAQHMGLAATDAEDFGQTLAVWGVGSGPFVVLPLMGPSTLRETAAMPVDWYSDPQTYIDHIRTKNTAKAMAVVNARAGFLPLEKSVTGDKYLFIRDAYLQRRNFLEKDGQVEDSFGAEEGGDYGD